MKTIIQSDNKMRDFWLTLLKKKNWTYTIEYQGNRTFAPKSYMDITEKQAEKLISLDLEKAIEKMGEIFFD